MKPLWRITVPKQANRGADGKGLDAGVVIEAFLLIEAATRADADRIAGVALNELAKLGVRKFEGTIQQRGDERREIKTACGGCGADGCPECDPEPRRALVPPYKAEERDVKPENVVEEERRASAAFALKLETLPGEPVEVIAEEAVRLSKELGVKIEMSFNGIRMVCWPEDSSANLLKAYRSDFGAEREGRPS